MANVGRLDNEEHVDALDRLRRCARPVIFETGHPSVPYSTAGTAFLAGFGRGLYIVTARHVIGTNPIQQLLVFPADRSRTPLRFSEWWNLSDDPNYPDLSDLILIRAEIRAIRRKDRRRSHLLNLIPRECSAWFEHRHSSKFFLFGYPRDHNWVDYEEQEIKTNQFLLPAQYRSDSISPGCHELTVENPLGLRDFSGLSGSPVCSLPFSIGVPAKPHFCGIAVRGGAESGRIHFVPASIILSALKDAEDAQQSLAPDRQTAAPFGSRRALRAGGG